MRLVLDVNVWISGLLWGGSPRQILNLAKGGAVTIFVSDPILNELTEVIARPKFQSRMRSLDITIEDLMGIAHELSETYIPIAVDVPELRDPDDAVIIGTAIAAKAKIIVSGDLDLLVLKEFANIPILTPTNFLNQPPMNV
jgi:hypothetical protein